MAKFKPYAARRLSGTFIKECIVAAETFEGAVVVYQRPALPEVGRLGLGVCSLVWHNQNLPGGAHPDIARDEKTPLQVAVSRIKEAMLNHGAEAEAVRLIGELSPFTKKELQTMADKLKSKGKPADAAAKGKGKTAPAAAADAAPATKAKGKGNPEALKKAQEASAGKRAEARAKKIKALKKPKDIEAREGSFRAQMLTDLLGCNGKTVGDFYEMNDKYDAGCLRFATEAGFVSVG